jgi:hypothetical protein
MTTEERKKLHKDRSEKVNAEGSDIDEDLGSEYSYASSLQSL